jgi:hypothetical protein
VGDDAGFRRPHVVRHDDQRGDERRCPGELLHRLPRRSSVVRAHADDQLCGTLGAHVRACIDDGALLVGIERRRLPRRAQRHDPCRTGVEILAAQPLERVDRHRPVLGERRDDRDVDTAEVRVGRHRAEGYLAPLGTGPA